MVALINADVPAGTFRFVGHVIGDPARNVVKDFNSHAATLSQAEAFEAQGFPLIICYISHKKE